MVHYHRFGRRKKPSAGPSNAGSWGGRLHPDWFDTSDVDHCEAALQFAKEIHRLPPHRAELIFRIRRQIAEGLYETPEKLEAAVEALYERNFADSGSQ
jgi:hypothetical protein